eukprot:GILJ01017491.1.p1 GENE.GILJ01017491.1~~GILJ01017491.1.p1  ORF type:complete len:463 (-),score=34.49 GILJ01017491.1:44-1432(-)
MVGCFFTDKNTTGFTFSTSFEVFSFCFICRVSDSLSYFSSMGQVVFQFIVDCDGHVVDGLENLFTHHHEQYDEVVTQVSQIPTDDDDNANKTILVVGCCDHFDPRRGHQVMWVQVGVTTAPEITRTAPPPTTPALHHHVSKTRSVTLSTTPNTGQSVWYQVVPSSRVADGTRDRHEEYQYLDLITKILTVGNRKDDRTGVGTMSTFGNMMRFDLSGNVFPLLTTKKVWWKGVVEELLWMVAGQTDGRLLMDKGVNIWKDNGTRAFLDNRGLVDRAEHDLGPVYGFQWRHFGAKYVNAQTDYTGQGVDQLAQIIETLRTNPSDRRMVMTAWNPTDLPLMALPPCHMVVQFYVTGDGRLCSLLDQRSCDVGLGVPFNIASYALLTRMVAQVTGLRPGEFVHVMGDTHVYLSHVDALRRQVENPPLHFPILDIDPTVTSIDDFRAHHFNLRDYESHPPIKMAMAV